MKIYFEVEEFDPLNPEYTKFAIFVDGDHCGELCMSKKQFPDFCQIVLTGIKDTYDEFYTTKGS